MSDHKTLEQEDEHSSKEIVATIICKATGFNIEYARQMAMVPESARLVDQYTTAKVAEARKDENNTAFLRILKTGTTKGLTAERLVEYHDTREAELSSLTNSNKGKNDENE